MKEKERERGKEMANALQGQHISALWASTIMSGTVAGTGIERQRGREKNDDRQVFAYKSYKLGRFSCCLQIFK